MSNILVDDVYVDETNANAIFTVRLDVANAAPVTVNYQTVRGTAGTNAEQDYSSTSGILTFVPGQVIETVSVPVLNNTIAEVTENFYLRLSSASANATIADAIGMATIIDNDAPSGTPVVSLNDFTVDEATKEATFIIALDRPSTSVVSMNYATQSGTAVAGSDFIAKNGSLVFAPGETFKTVKVTLTNDNAFEASEAFNLSLSALTNATTLDAIGTAIIAENDAAPVSNSKISVDDIFVDESQTYADFVVRLDAPNTGAVIVNYDTVAGTAGSNAERDYSSAGGYLTFAPGEMVKTIRVTLLNNTIAEVTENFYLRLPSASVNATIADAIGMATIIDNDAPSGTPVVSLNDFTVDEATKEATFVIALDRPSTSVVSMNYATQNGTAVAGSDFIAKNGSLVFAPGETVKTVKVTLTNDNAFEASEAFNLSLSALTNATTLDAIGTAIITENDATPVSNSKISVDDIFVDESQTYADFVVRLDAPNAGAITVNYQTVGGTAGPNAERDYSSADGYLTFAPGEMVKTVRVTLLDNAIAEVVENFSFQLYSPSANATIIKGARATIIDNDATTGTPAASIIDAVVDESDQTATVTVVLNKPSTSWTSLDVAGQNITAVGSDYRALQIGKIAIAPGETEKTVTFALLNDALVEGTELFDVVLTNPVGVTLGDARAHAIIAGNDNAAVVSPVLHVANVAASEDKGYIDFLVTLTAPSISGAQVNYSTSSGTASSSSDFSSASGTVVFASGEVARVVRIVLNDDITAEALENFTFNLSGAVNATIGTASATATIIDNESAAPAAPIAIAGTAGNDILQGTQFADAMTGAAGNDIFNGGAGNDSMAGGGGNDIYLVENSGDTYTEAAGAGAGTDLVISYLTTHTLGANAENLQLAGTATTGIGNSLNNTITGNTRDNTINGSSGNDTLNGATGSDTLSGGAGADFFVFSTALNATTNVDIVTDFNVTDDTIRLENAIFTQFTATGAIPAGTFVSGAGAVALDGNDFLIYNTTNGNLSYDADGNGAGAQVVFASLTGIPVLTPADFIVI
ncbi:Calx-beta domain-containing protein [Nitrosomonas ureae]|uniref:Calx-beta domain-containing protein n=1 Tax=Nitrosomonas ureae TaxID=44577 RepID=A0A286AJL5_9PROT|nr:Calx-beta domain-containing protein [Nitrosomonas ureae]SOD22098.1 Calx-beta domain-containing protein [Nitrosomonas ureae]